jgi:hypothetical protein
MGHRIQSATGTTKKYLATSRCVPVQVSISWRGLDSGQDHGEPNANGESCRGMTG